MITTNQIENPATAPGFFMPTFGAGKPALLWFFRCFVGGRPKCGAAVLFSANVLVVEFVWNAGAFARRKI